MSTAAAGRRLAPQASPSAQPLAESDPELAGIVGRELKRQQEEIELIASENHVSRAVLEAAGTVLTNKYAEGYPGHRYYGGCQYLDQVEILAIERAKTAVQVQVRQRAVALGAQCQSGSVHGDDAAGRSRSSASASSSAGI